MRAFISYAAVDKPLADFLIEAVGSGLGVDFFIMPRDAPPGLPWIDQIKRGVAACDELWSIITPNSASRPWISAEWACFWYQGKPTVPLLAGSSFDELWEPMRAHQSYKLDDYSSVAGFLRTVADRTGVQPPAGITPTAGEVSREVPLIRQRQVVANLEEVFARLVRDVRSGTENVQPEDVQALVRGNRLEELMQLATGDQASPVKQRQVAISLLESGRTGEAGTLASVISNRAEARTVAVRIVQRIPRGATIASEEWQALDRLYDRLRFPQRRDVLAAMDAAGVAPLGRWGEGPGSID